MAMNEEIRAAKYSDLFEEPHAQQSDCAYCPICTTISVVRSTKPEVLDHLAKAARELLVAAGILLEEAGEFIASDKGPQIHPVPDAESKVTHLDIG
ncbi:MAG TPA: hypothetical protein VG408_05170 [Actinomycetota bacterium]|nr:hypothetical protein [Actinomycetota bacterium]